MTRHHEGLKPESYLAILNHHADKGEGWQKEVAVGTVIQYVQRGHDDRHQRWDRLECVDLLAQYGALAVQGMSQDRLDACTAVVASFQSVAGLSFLPRLVSALRLVCGNGCLWDLLGVPVVEAHGPQSVRQCVLWRQKLVDFQIV